MAWDAVVKLFKGLIKVRLLGIPAKTVIQIFFGLWNTVVNKLAYSFIFIHISLQYLGTQYYYSKKIISWSLEQGQGDCVRDYPCSRQQIMLSKLKDILVYESTIVFVGSVSRQVFSRQDLSIYLHLVGIIPNR